MQYSTQGGRAVLRRRGVRSFGVAKRNEIRRRCERMATEEMGPYPHPPPAFRYFRVQKLERYFGLG